jgi:regulatory protein
MVNFNDMPEKTGIIRPGGGGIKFTPEERVARLLSDMERICSQREYCVEDIRKKLKRYEIAEKEHEIIIARLISSDFLNEQRYAKALVRDRSRLNKWGRNKIIYELKRKKLDDSIIQEAIKELPAEMNNENLKELLLRRSLGLKEDTEEKKIAKLIRFALSRGFDYDAAYREAKEITCRKADK